jgi:hypothetical protein
LKTDMGLTAARKIFGEPTRCSADGNRSSPERTKSIGPVHLRVFHCQNPLVIVSPNVIVLSPKIGTSRESGP